MSSQRGRQHARCKAGVRRGRSAIFEVAAGGSHRRPEPAQFLILGSSSPDLVRGALRHRHSDWSCVFGQSGGTETLLRKAGVGALDGVGEEVFIKKGDPGPLFLFFGWYRRAVRDNRGYSFAPVAQGDGVHALFGWLQAARKVNFAGEVDRKAFARANPWAAKHPHVSCPCSDGQPNAIYIAPKPDTEEDVLNLDGVKTNLRASGMFSTFNPAVHTLTLQGHTKRVWRLPKWFFRGGEPTLGMHDNAPWRWQAINGQPEYIQLQSVDIGQEFVFNTERYDRELVHAWVKRIIEAGDGPLETLA